MLKFKSSSLKIIILLCFCIFYSNKINKKNKIINDLEDNLSFEKKSTTIKSVALYNTKYYLMNGSLINNRNNTRKISSNMSSDKIESQINLAKMHGIYGFCFYFFWPSKSKIFNRPIDIIVENKNLNIYFLIFWKNEENKISHNYNICEFFSEIKKYVVDRRYIKINDKPVIGIDNLNINEQNINTLRLLFKKNKLGNIFILSNINDKNIYYIINSGFVDGVYYSTQYNSLKKAFFRHSKSIVYFYTHLLYHNLFLTFPNNIKIFRTSEALTKYPIYFKKRKIKTYIYGDYSPEKFYFLNKIIMNWTLANHKKDNQFIFINNYHNLEQNTLLGYANINYFSKALYGLPILNDNYNLINLKNNVLICIQIHVFYVDLLGEIIKKVNSIPVPFDLYITTNSLKKKTYIDNYLKNNSRGNRNEVLVTRNRGRDVTPLLIQLKDVYKKYKYFCHIHTKKHTKLARLGLYWRIYLYENLLGNRSIISNILSCFENNNKLGLIFPAPFHLIINDVFHNNPRNIKHLNNLMHILFPERRTKIKNVLNFPAGNMFWARTSAIYQIFNEKIIGAVPEEKGQNDGTILHGIERFWPFLVKFNGYYSKTIFYAI